MVGDEEHDGVVGHAAALERVEDFADLFIDIGNIGEIAAPRPAHLLGRDVEGRMIARLHQSLRMRVLLVEGDFRHFGVERRAAFIEIPEAAAGDIGIVRVGEADGRDTTAAHHGRATGRAVCGSRDRRPRRHIPSGW